MDHVEKFEDFLSRMQGLLDNAKKQGHIIVRLEDLESTFPELKKSEDERIKEDLIQWINEFPDTVWRGHYKKDVIAWLEKQNSYYTFEIKKGHWYKCICDYMLNSSDLMFKNDRLYYCRSNWRLRGEIDERNVKDMGVNGYKSFFRPATNQEIKDWLEKKGEQKEINLVEILKHYPKETELYSPLYGSLWLAEVDEKNEIITCYKHHLEEGCTRAVLEQEDTVSFYSNGTTGLPDFNVSKDCMLFLYDVTKQGEQKPFDYENVNIQQKDFAPKSAMEAIKEENVDNANKADPKFKIGDWITNGHCTCQITFIDSRYWYSKSCVLGDIASIDKTFHLWSINDAKDGDVLVGSKDGVILMFRGIGNTEWDNVIDYHCYYDCYHEVFIVQEDAEYWGYTEDNQLKPATKEQRDILEKAMADARYTFNFEKKKLEKIK